MWLLIVLCSSVSCAEDMSAIHREPTESRCIEQGRAQFPEFGVTWMCVRDRTLYNPLYEEFE